MVKILAVTSGNGGMGKSILACNIACGLCSFGKKVLLAECSFGFRSIDAISGIKAETLFTFSDVCRGEGSVFDAITKAEDGKTPDFIPAGLKKPEADFKKAFSNIKSTLSGEYDYIVFDVSANCGGVFEALCNVCNCFIVLTDDSFVSVRNAAHCVDYIKGISNSKVHTVLNKISISSNNDSAFVEDIIDEIKAPLLGIIPYDEHLPLSIEKGSPIINYNTYAGRAIENICKRLEGISVPEFETGVSGGFFSKNKFVLK